MLEGMPPVAFDNPPAVAHALDAAGYLPDDGLATAAFLAMRMHRPLFLEGDPGVGKTALAQALAEVTGARLIRLQCYEGIDAAQALYDWDFPRQILHLRAAGATAHTAAEQAGRTLLERPEDRAGDEVAAVVQRRLEFGLLGCGVGGGAGDEFEAFLL